MRRLPALALAGATTFTAAHVHAEAKATAPAGILGVTQQSLTVIARADGLFASVCAKAPCSGDGTSLQVPEEAKPKLAQATVRAVDLPGGTHLVRVDVPLEGGASWTALVAGPVEKQATDPLLVWSGVVGQTRGEAGEQRKNVLIDEPAGGGTRRFIVGAQFENATICGRPATISARVLDSATFEMKKGASVQSLSVEERVRAPRIGATRLTADAPAPKIRLLRAMAASSAVNHQVGGLTDGDLATSWSEDRIGDGRGEFVRLSSASEIGIDWLELVVRPTGDVPDGASPHTFYLATEGELLRVTLPDDGWQKGAHYKIALPKPLKTSCLALVLDEATANRPTTRTTLAELVAHTALDDASEEALVGALAGGDERARAAEAMLERGGASAGKAAMAGYAKLDDAGKELARHVVDAAPCSAQVPFYAKLFGESAERGKKAAAPGDVDPEFSHAQSRLRSCKNDAAGALVAVLTSGSDKARLAAASELPFLAPDRAVVALLDALPAASPATRPSIAGALTNAARSERAKPVLQREIALEAFQKRPEPVRVVLLRALGPGIATIEGAPAAFADVAKPSAPFETRYLLLAPAAELARAGDAGATSFLRASLSQDADPHVRLGAAEAAARAPALGPEIARALDDADPRVREAAIGSFFALEPASRPAAASVALVRRLSTDDWTFVRSAAARALGVAASSPEADKALANAVDDKSPEVRGQALDALGARGARAYASLVRDRAGKTDETPEVRGHAIAALGAMCDAESVGALEKIALRAKMPFDETGARLGGPAIAALGVLHPPDLDRRLAPLLTKDVAAPVREMAKSAIASTGKCGAK